ncbi:MAG: hypothetical protein ACREIC_07930 [Limisphaerales bacterium]
MKAWEIWTGQLFGPHPVLLISAQARIDRKQAVVVLKGVTMRPGQPFKVDALQATLDQEDGLQTQTRFDCDLLYTLEKSGLTQRRGEVASLERRRDISRKIIQGLAIAGV